MSFVVFDDVFKSVFLVDDLRFEIFCGVSLEVGVGDYVFIVGCLGLGKFILFNIFGMLDVLIFGLVFFEGCEVCCM